jgi:7,8-dihydropterin-6-yl-methyl-4-(beta-D-ribofuranosyl)aminobenzene 5'-phosphate synthase
MVFPQSKLAIVDKLTITFLVDNCIEWYVVYLRYRHANEDSLRMTKLPPGFTHELPQHLQQHGHGVDTVMGVPAFDFEKFCCGEPLVNAAIEPPRSLAQIVCY